ncbi:DUF411 domain-containing protein [Natronoarchaeum sp. GCM10025703]|uniref:DUF411 domain-containing protein n=1 Tax=unclassified Natronoarchaeum TaxID=2620183 RepID=UPI00361ACBA6
MSDRVSRRSLLAAGSSVAAVSVAGCLGGDSTDEWSYSGTLSATAHQYNSPNCDCCGAYGEYLDEHLDGSLSSSVREDIGTVKTDLGIPGDLQSCHTVEVGSYFVEGHVPVETIATLLDDSPDIAGIALPGMPAGSPGMGGAKDEKWTVYAVDKEADIEPFVEL